MGVVTHYYGHLQVAIVKLESGTLRVGDTVHVKGHTSDFRQKVESLQIEHAAVEEVKAGDEFGLKVTEHAREHDVVYKVAGT
jgi:putative protease